MNALTEWRITTKATLVAALVASAVAAGVASRTGGSDRLTQLTAATAEPSPLPEPLPDPRCAPYYCDPEPTTTTTLAPTTTTTQRPVTTTTAPTPPTTQLAPAQVIERIIVVEPGQTLPVATPPAAKPTGLTVTRDGDQLTITWDPVANAEGYAVMVAGQGRSAACCQLVTTAPGSGEVKVSAAVRGLPSPGQNDWATATIPEAVTAPA